MICKPIYIIGLSITFFFGLSFVSLWENGIDVQDEVGTRQYIWTDAGRTDFHYQEERIVNVQIWYPAQLNEGRSPNQKTEYYAFLDDHWKSLPGWSKDDYEFVTGIITQSYQDLEIDTSRGQLPVLIFSPSLGSHIAFYNFYGEYLARRGYVVVGINHLYESEFVVGSEGHLYHQDLSYHDSIESLSIPEEISADHFRSLKSKRSEVLGKDIVFVLDKLEEISDTDFSGRLDFGRIGVWGHSIGGAAAICASMSDSRIKAVVNMDGTPPTNGLEEGMKVPFLFLEDLTDYLNHNGYKIQYDRRNGFCARGSADAFRILIGGIRHNSFWDLHRHTAGSIADANKHDKFLQKIGNFMGDFFDAYLEEGQFLSSSVKTDSLEVIVFSKP